MLGNADLPTFGMNGKVSQRVPSHNWICDLIVHCSIQVISWHLLGEKKARTPGPKGLAMEECVQDLLQTNILQTKDIGLSLPQMRKKKEGGLHSVIH